MFRVKSAFAVAVMGAAVMAGCDSKSEPMTPPPAPTTPAPAPTAEATPPAGGGMMDAARDAAPAATEKMGTMATDAKAAMSDAAAKTPPAAAGMADAVTAEASTLIDQGMTYVKENKWDLADGTIAKLEAMKDKMPETLKPRYAQLKSMYDSAKAGKGMALPGMPK